MNASLMINFHDDRGYVEIILTEYPEIVRDGHNILFTDDDGNDYTLSTTQVDYITAVDY